MKKFKFIFFLILVMLIKSNISFSQTKEIELAKHYANKEEYDKALELFQKIEKRKENISQIHNIYFKLLVDLGKWKEAEKYMSKVINWFPNRSQYWVDKGMIYFSMGDREKTEIYFDDLINKFSRDKKLNVLASQLANNRLYNYSIKAYLMLEKKSNKKSDQYSLQIASLYAITNQKQKMIEKYIKYLNKHPHSISYIQNMMQSYLTEKKDKEKLRLLLLENIQKNHKKLEYRELLLWLNLQEQDFNAAFLQAKALDNLRKTTGEKCKQVAEIASNNKTYATAVEIYKYLVGKYQRSPLYFSYRKNMIKNKEKLILENKSNVTDEIIKELINDYQNIIKDTNEKVIVMQIKKEQAYLTAFYLHNYDKAISILKDILASLPSRRLKAEINILLADIYIIQGDMWEPTLLYYQVEKDLKETDIGRQARYNNARLSFFRGDFDLATDQLNVLKIATSQKIANDALHLLLLISDNKNEEDNTILKSYANLELLTYQNKVSLAMDSLNYFIDGKKAKQLEEEMLFLRAKLYRQKKEYQKSLQDLTLIVDNYSYDILADDALFMKAKIYESELSNTPQAMECYEKLIKEYPASFYADESRQKFRTLRGDKL